MKVMLKYSLYTIKNSVLEQTYIQLIEMVSRQIQGKLMA